MDNDKIELNTMDCPFFNSDGFGFIDCCYESDYTVKCPIKDLCDSKGDMWRTVSNIIYDCLETEKKSRKLYENNA